MAAAAGSRVRHACGAPTLGRPAPPPTTAWGCGLPRWSTAGRAELASQQHQQPAGDGRPGFPAPLRGAAVLCRAAHLQLCQLRLRARRYPNYEAWTPGPCDAVSSAATFAPWSFAPARQCGSRRSTAGGPATLDWLCVYKPRCGCRCNACGLVWKKQGRLRDIRTLKNCGRGAGVSAARSAPAAHNRLFRTLESLSCLIMLLPFFSPAEAPQAD